MTADATFKGYAACSHCIVDSLVMSPRRSLVAQAIRVLACIFAGLMYLHNSGNVHLKPG